MVSEKAENLYKCNSDEGQDASCSKQDRQWAIQLKRPLLFLLSHSCKNLEWINILKDYKSQLDSEEVFEMTDKSY